MSIDPSPGPEWKTPAGPALSPPASRVSAWTPRSASPTSMCLPALMAPAIERYVQSVSDVCDAVGMDTPSVADEVPRRLNAWWIGVFALASLVFFFLAGAGVAPAQDEPEDDILFNNDYCLGCHSQEGMQTTLPSGEVLDLTFDLDAFDTSVHGEFDIPCALCHTDITPFPHEPITSLDARAFTIERAVALCVREDVLEVYTELIVGLVRQISAVQTSIRHFDHLIEKRSSEHQDVRIFNTLPGAGAALAARLLGFFGSDRDKYESAAALQKHSGVAPITKQSGKMHFVHRRYACNKFWRQTFVEWAAQSVMKSLWAKAYYLQQKAKGQRHQSILRSLAYKWQRIVFRCWKNHENYDEKRYLQVFEKRSSPLLPIIADIRKTHPKLCEQFA